MPSFYSCSSSTAHEPTDQGEMIGCRDCRVDQFAGSTGFFRSKHIYEEGDPQTPEVSYFTYDPSDHSLSIATTGETVILDDAEDFIRHWLTRGDLYWNEKHQSANWLTPQVEYGVTGSGTTKVGEFTSDLSGVLVAKLFEPDAHPYPVDPEGQAVKDLEAWPWMCSCGGKAPRGESVCLGCRQKGRE